MTDNYSERIAAEPAEVAHAPGLLAAQAHRFEQIVRGGDGLFKRAPAGRRLRPLVLLPGDERVACEAMPAPTGVATHHFGPAQMRRAGTRTATRRQTPCQAPHGWPCWQFVGYAHQPGRTTLPMALVEHIFEKMSESVLDEGP
jgi:hypothetical protein